MVNTNLDTTPLPPNNFVAQDPESTELAGYVRTKTFGRDVRESIARSIELNSTRSKSAEILAQETLQVTKTATSNMANQVELIRAEKDAVIANATVDSEVILARGGKATLGQRLDETAAQLTHTHQHIAEISVNLKTYNELANGDDWSNALQQAISDYDSLTLFIPNGEYTIDTLPLKHNVRYLGAENTVVKLKNTVDINTLENVEIKGIKFKPQTLPIEPVKNYVNILNSKNINIEKCVFDGENSYFTSGINATDSENVSVVDNEITKLRTHKGVQFVGCSNGKIKDNRITRTGRAGISVNHSNKNIMVKGNYLSENKINFDVEDGAIDLYGVAGNGTRNEHIDIIGNYIEQYGSEVSSSMGIRIKDTHYINIKDNKIICSEYSSRLIYVDVRGNLNTENIVIKNNELVLPTGSITEHVVDINDVVKNIEFKNLITGDGTITSSVIQIRKPMENALFHLNTMDVINNRERILYFAPLSGGKKHSQVNIIGNLLKGNHQIELNNIDGLQFKNNTINTLDYNFTAIKVSGCFNYFTGDNTIMGKTPNFSYSGGSGSSGYIRGENLSINTSV